MPADARFPFQDSALDVGARVEDLVSRLSIEEKVGQLFHPMGTLQDVDTPNREFDLPALRPTIVEQHITHYGLLGTTATPREFAQWHNHVQRIALASGHGVPVTFSTDTRHPVTTDPRNALTGDPASESPAGFFSRWPDTLGLAAIGDEQLVERFASIVREEYRAVGLTVALHPQLDLATEPRWPRIFTTFGEDVDLVTRFARAYVRGLQGSAFGPDSVSAMIKHFPGGGPQRDGEDPHFPYGREQVYPGGRFETHLAPFVAALDAGARQVMPYYGMPVGTEYEEVGFGFNRSVVTGILRERLGFDGIVCTDWSLVTDHVAMHDHTSARAWGVEHLTEIERVAKVLDAGADQFGGEYRTDLVLDLLRTGRLSEARLDESVRRILREKFELGLFDRPFLDADRADAVVGSAAFVEEGLAAQRRSLTLLTNGATEPVLPLRTGVSVYVEGVDGSVLTPRAVLAEHPEGADVAVIRVSAPYEPRDGLAAGFHTGSLAFPDQQVEHIEAIASQVPVVLVVYLDRPAILGRLTEVASAVVADFGVSDAALADVLLGADAPQGSLPFDLPSSMEAVERSRSDVPFDTQRPQFRCGHGLRYG
ncbi:glycoside hydrolase family 3 C-terminal domain-containing protein [Actinotalea sp. M2MS4P-6]|uniref:glycoside hydrolase family 3 protein n=1 Tax=Actinotalea sp. M2MS4P-6 TaxID=2983762 RepID=UPI0021E50BD8|nr:glycoside hydrolase family 3 N-terminal domain-containing protein [Actinotalea sp. M2MS4P-6]MCV2395314.1 glycoside hydrolase family 3 C-terminal domain-containing protein [Actinotalea sp. M2MS4P-6]